MLKTILRRAAAACAVGATAAVLAVTPAAALAPHWATTHNNPGSNTLTVRWCSGGTGTLGGGKTTTRNVCGLLLRNERELYVYVKQTGTLLYDVVNCSGDRWVTFTTRTDTSRTAEVLYQSPGSNACA